MCLLPIIKFEFQNKRKFLKMSVCRHELVSQQIVVNVSEFEFYKLHNEGPSLLHSGLGQHLTPTPH